MSSRYLLRANTKLHWININLIFTRPSVIRIFVIEILLTDLLEKMSLNKFMFILMSFCALANHVYLFIYFVFFFFRLSKRTQTIGSDAEKTVSNHQTFPDRIYFKLNFFFLMFRRTTIWIYVSRVHSKNKYLEFVYNETTFKLSIRNLNKIIFFLTYKRDIYFSILNLRFFFVFFLFFLIKLNYKWIYCQRP